MSTIRIWERADVVVALRLCGYPFDGLADRIEGRSNTNDLRDAARALAFHIATDRSTPEKTRALRALLGYARRQGRGGRIMRTIGASWAQAAERSDRLDTLQDAAVVRARDHESGWPERFRGLASEGVSR
jgi:hypothetical protein